MKPLLCSLALLTGLGACRSSEARPDAAAPPAAPSSVFGVFPLRYASATELAAVLSRAWPVRVVPDARTNSLLVTCATEEELTRVGESIALLDVQVEAK